MSSNLQTHSMGLPDIISTSLNVVFCGINPGMRSAAVGLPSRTEVIAFGVSFTSQALPPGNLNRRRHASCSIMVVGSPPQLLARQSAQPTSVEPTTSLPVPLSSAKSRSTGPDTWPSWESRRVSVFLNQRTFRGDYSRLHSADLRSGYYPIRAA